MTTKNVTKTYKIEYFNNLCGDKCEALIHTDPDCLLYDKLLEYERVDNIDEDDGNIMRCKKCLKENK